MRKSFLIIWVALLGIAPIVKSVAQGITTAAINGIIQDAKKQPVPGATITAIHQPTGTRYLAAARADGRFFLPNLRVGGPYELTVTSIGFAEQKEANIFLNLSETRDLNFVVQESNTTLTTVEIAGRSSDIINAGRNGAGTNVSKENIERLPTISRSFQDFTRLTPQANRNSLMGRNGRFNNIQIDGASNNDLFGLGNTGAPGGQSGTTPISLDAIEQFQVALSPYDVRQGRFSGGGINAITRSGTNNVEGSVFFYTRNQDLTSSKNVEGNTEKINNFSDYQTGFRVGAPIIKNKLFIFLNGEITRRTEPLVFGVRRPGQPMSATTVNSITTATLQTISDTLARRFGYQTGSFGAEPRRTESNKVFIRLDYNINENHQITLRHNFLDAFQDELTRSANEVRFFNNAFQISNQTNSSVLELKSRFGQMSNNLIVGYSTIRDKRDVYGSLFPSVTVTMGGTNIIAGSQRSSVFNSLNQDALEITDNFSMFLGRHTLTFGTNNEIFRFNNTFVNDGLGRYDFPDSASFMAGRSSSNNYRFRLNFPLPGGQPSAKFSAATFGLYAQDEFQASSNLNLTVGLRVDLPVFFETPSRNINVENTFNNPAADSVNYGLATNKMPKIVPLFSPRIGFNWDVLSDKTTQVRGGVGVFTGRIPYVWISNQYANTGVDFGSVDLTGAAAPILRTMVADSITKLVAASASPTRSTVSVVSPTFRMPQMLRANLAVDRKLPYGLVLTLEGIYTKTINDVLPINVNLRTARTTVPGDGRPMFPGNGGSGRFINNTNFNEVIVADNTSKGYQYSLTAQLQKPFGDGWFATTAYTYGQSRDLYSGGSATPLSTWEFNQHASSPNNLPMSYSQFDLRHRVLAAVSYNIEYAKFMGTTVSLFYNGQSGQAFSYVYTNDLNGDGGRSNDLIYVPRTQDEILLTTAGPGDDRTIAQIWNQLNTFIENDPYLNSKRGQYAARNGGRTPWVNQIDIKILQDFYVKIKEKRHAFQFSVDLLNFGNMLSYKWGKNYFVGNQSFETLNFRGMNGTGASARPTYSFGTSSTGVPPSAWQVDALASRWQAQIGLRYIFN